MRSLRKYSPPCSPPVGQDGDRHGDICLGLPRVALPAHGKDGTALVTRQGCCLALLQADVACCNLALVQRDERRAGKVQYESLPSAAKY